MVSADAVIMGFLCPLTTGFTGSGMGSSAGLTVVENALCAKRRALVRVATESDIPRLYDGRVDALGLEFENASDRRSCNLGYLLEKRAL